jgi:hypothetical protein
MSIKPSEKISQLFISHHPKTLIRIPLKQLYPPLQEKNCRFEAQTKSI